MFRRIKVEGKGECPYCKGDHGYHRHDLADKDWDGNGLYAEWWFSSCLGCGQDVLVREVRVAQTRTIEIKMMSMEDGDN